ncbi:hypothetical protein Misp01_00150 [Microtetraspora sp. NBRC 13810]|uniref:DMT family transporter n=1 Tax=Microtetraspora sp. NBRC 13810 TaxID=3030990 RepID=UPI00249FEC6F|nr:DMT family transporter [Microtetraspora sp. NBRC 13810]GLW04885.1 hypothetical protein Misp01_00150 [Microtetraspora sp. NBRC 13810]
MTVLAAALALLGSLFFALGAAVQQFEAVRAAERGRTGLLSLAGRPRWLFGGVSIAVGGGLHIVALAFGPLTVVQPMGVASLLFALPIAAALHGRRPSRAELAAAGAVAAGLAGLVLIVPPATGSPDLSGPAAVALLAIAGAVALALWGGARLTGPAPRAALLAMAAGVLYGATATLTRVLLDGSWEWWFWLVMPLPALVALAVLQRAYAIGRFGVAFAALQLADPLTAIAFGALLLDEPLPTGPTGVLTAIAAGALTCAGTFALARTTPLPR